MLEMFSDTKRVAVNQDDILISDLHRADHNARVSKVEKFCVK